MKKIEDWNKIDENGNFKLLPPGAYVVEITGIIDHPDKEWLEIYFDIAEGEHTKYFTNLLAKTNGVDKSRTLRSYSTKAMKFFKRFITSIERSNEGFVWDWDEKKLVGKKLVAVYGEEEYIHTNDDGIKEMRTSCKVVDWHSTKALKEGTIVLPQKKLLTDQQKLEIEESKKLAAEKPQDNNGAVVADDDLPF